MEGEHILGQINHPCGVGVNCVVSLHHSDIPRCMLHCLLSTSTAWSANMDYYEELRVGKMGPIDNSIPMVRNRKGE